jgi:hypothetical protein
VAEHEMKMPAKNTKRDAEEGNGKMPSQRRRPESGRYLLQVDRQTKSSFQTFDAARIAGLGIKKTNPILQVTIYDSVDYSATLVDAPTA